MAERRPQPSPARSTASMGSERLDEGGGPVDTLTINEDTVTLEEVVAPIRAELTAAGATLTPTQYQERLVRRVRDRIRMLARDLLLYQEASRRLSDQENEYLDKFTDQRIRDIVQREYNGRQVRWEQALAAQGLTLSKAREQIRRELVIVRHLQQTITPLVQEPTRRDLMRYFEKHKQEMTSPERREMFLIEVPKGDDPPAARTLAEEALAKLNNGAEFEAMAAEYSQGINADSGGHWGMVDASSVRGRWAKAADALAALTPGQTSGLVEGDQSYFIVRLGHIEPAQEPDFAQVQVRLKKSYHDQQFNALVDELVARLQNQATIRPANLNVFLEAAVDACLTPETNLAAGP